MNTLDSNHSLQVDVLIIGGGPSGTSAGIALLKRGDMEVMLIERGNYSEEKYSESLSSGARSTMEYLDVWHNFASTQNLDPFYSQVSWGLESQRQLGYMFTPNGAGWNLDRLAFDRLMAKTFVKHGGRMLCESQVITCSRAAGGGWLVNVKSGDQDMQTVHCKYIIDASGRRGVMRTNLNLALTVHDRLIGIACVAHIPTDTEVKIENQVEACKYGWWHMAPMANNRVSVVLMTDPDIAHKLQACHPDVWYGMLKELPFMGEIAKQLEFTERPRSFPCFSSFLGEAGGKDWVAVGDAVASYDPISSSGIPRALASGMHGAFIAVDSLLSKGELLGTYSQAIEQEFRQYLQTRWQYYHRETRWPDSVFWARRRAVIAISKEAKVHATHYFEQKLSTSPVHLKSNELQDLWFCCELGKSVGDVLVDFSKRHLHIPEQKVLLGLQELIETGYLDISMEDEEDRVFFNTERLYFD